MNDQSEKQNVKRWRHRFTFDSDQSLHVLLWLAFFLFYAATTAKDILPADSGEFQLVAATWGIAHPPGYPLYTILSALWVRFVPFGSIPYRLNLLSAILAATSLLFVYFAVTRWLVHWQTKPRHARIAGFIAAMALGISSTFWSQATTANIRMPSMLFATWIYWILARYACNGRQTTHLYELALALGLAVGHHPSLIFVAVGWFLYLVLIDAKRLFSLKVILIGAASWVAPQLYLPFRDRMSGVLFAPGNLTTWNGFWNHVLARGFSGDMFAYIGWTDLRLRLPLLPTLFGMQYSVPIIAAMLVAIIWLLHRQPRLAVSFFVSWIIHTFVTITYRAPQTIEYLMPAYVPMALVLGIGAGDVLHAISFTHPNLSKIVHRFAGLTAILLACGLLFHAIDFAQIANDTSVRNRLQPLLETASSDAVILADWHWATPLWGLQYFEQKGPSVTVEYVLPQPDLEYGQVWRKAAERYADHQTYATHYYEWPDWNFAPVAGGYRVVKRPLTNALSNLDYLALSKDLGPIRLLGYQITSISASGRRMEINLAWQAIDTQNPQPSFATRLWGENRQLLASADRALGSDAAIGEIRFTQISLQLPLIHCPPQITPSVAVYTVVDGAFVDHGMLDLPPVSVSCTSVDLPVVQYWPGMIAPKGPFLLGVDYDTGFGQTAYAYMHVCGPGEPVNVSSQTGQAYIRQLHLGDCETIQLSVPAGRSPDLTITRGNGKPAKLISIPLRQAHAGERYTPYSENFVLIGTDVHTGTDQTLAKLRWRTAGPVIDDYGVSVRLLDASGGWLGAHDMQPGLGAIPTLKWTCRGLVVLDPHPIDTDIMLAARLQIAVYERFRMTPVTSPYGDVITYELPADRNHVTITTDTNNN